MKKFFKKSYIFIALILIIIFVILLNNGAMLKEGIKVSLQEDFKIKESLGQLFFLEKTQEDASVSGNVNVTSLAMPCNGVVSQGEILGDKCITISTDMFEGVYATADGVIENAGNNKISIRHYDGKLSSYYGATCLLKQGEKVAKGDVIGYSKGDLIFKLYENCTCIDPMEYINLNENK